MFTSVWRFTVRPDATGEFEQQYGADGAWVHLFRTAPGYIDTSLYRDTVHGREYVTIDRWVDEEAFRTFRNSHAAEYERLDRELESLTMSEVHVGDWTPR